MLGSGINVTNVLFDANRACTECALRDDCQGPVPAEGPMDARIAFIGEAPGSNEDKTGKPFRGAAGRYFDSLLRSVGIDRDEVWVSNTTKCRPKGNRTPTTEEVDYCASRWLDVELNMVQPKIIVPMGDAAISHFLGEGMVRDRHGIPVRKGGRDIFPVYHPAAGLHNTGLMSDIQADFRGLREVLDGVWEPVTDQFPITIYKDMRGKEIPGEDDGRLVSIDTEIVDGKLWSVQLSDAAGEGFLFQTVPVKLSNCTVHNYLFDAQYVDLPQDTKDTMLMAYLLGLPQGLKELSRSLCGMDMESYLEVVSEYSKEKALGYLKEAALEEWPDPPAIEDIVWNKKQQRLDIKTKKPQHISRKIKRILADFYGGKKNKSGEDVNPYRRWMNIDLREREVVESVLGHMPEGNLSDAPPDKMLHYACRDADAGFRVHNILWPMIIEKGMLPVYVLDQATLPVALEMMKNGIKIDVGGLNRLSTSYTESMKTVAEEIFQMVDKRFNPNSDDELRILFFQDLGFIPTKTTPTGLPSVAGESLAKIDHPVVKMIEEYRHLAHLRDSFCDTLPGKADIDGRVHPTIRTTRTATGRWSMANPNCQQIPVRTTLGREIRRQFVADGGKKLVAIDYSQIELRVAAHLSQCRSMIEAFRQGRDIHTETAVRLFGTPEPSSYQRYAAKTLNFGVIYGITAEGFLAQMQVEGQDWTVEDCREFIKESNSLRPELWDWQEETKAFAIRNGYVTDMFGRRRYLPEILCPVEWIRNSGEREAINMPVQSGAQGVIKMAMGKLWRDHGDIKDIRWLLQIHDELLWETEDAERLVYLFSPVMENVVHLSVPIKVEAKVGDNWGEMNPCQPNSKTVTTI